MTDQQLQQKAELFAEQKSDGLLERGGIVIGYLEGHKAALSDQWISVKDRLPETKESLFGSLVSPLVQIKFEQHDRIFSGVGRLINNQWHHCSGYLVTVLAWSPILEP